MKVPKKIITFHEIADFQQCRLCWSFAWLEHLKPLEIKPQLKLGTQVHEALARFYLALPQERTLELLVSNLPEEAPGKLADILVSLWNKFGQDSLVNGNVEGEYSYEPPDKPYALIAHPDLMSYKNGHLILYEHKTGQDPELEYYLFFDTQKWF